MTWIFFSDLQIQVFSATQANSYKSLALIDNVLYIGARGKLFRQNAGKLAESSIKIQKIHIFFFTSDSLE